MGFIKYIVDLGPSVMLPIVIFIISLILGQKPGKALRSGVTIGIGFIGIGLVIGLMLNNIGPAAQSMSKNFGIHLNVVDVGWPGDSPMVWAGPIAITAIPIAIAVNILMLIFGLTKVVNVDIWNIWHMAFTGTILYIATNSIWIAWIGVVIHAAIAYKFGDWYSPIVNDFFGLEGVAIPHGTSAYCAPLAVPIEWLIDRIPGLNKININSKNIEKRFGVFGEPMIIGLILGIIIGILAGYNFKEIAQLGMNMAAVMILMPQVVKLIMQGLMPVSEAAKDYLQKKFNGKQFYIGLDPALLLGDSDVVAASLLFVPITLILAIIIPGNQVLPFGDLATIGFFVAIAVGIHNANLFRTIISGSVIMSITIWIANKTIPLLTQLAKMVNMLPKGTTHVAALDQGGSPLTYLLLQVFNYKNMGNLIVFILLGLYYLLGLYMSAKYLKNKSYVKDEDIG
ncbi:PTS galactitol transporter subunit IIC [Thermoanaerobacterium thermosaccharolyticum]|uniref:PTS galactitol transporter subunit IIC n=1 Tax=Thermoanaerobacterium thermosaccharolyticum TaxID=1517 RepID=A0A223HW63_THETR|nr:galactitol-specific PTS transporter subunit IIC [Thermoanaerobacterium thermosaccharolyticum]AST56524.1 PTS galactitol transporter subunit IIC [Thermoanaerobacterium thermosaccharolyticum]MDK2827889.1 galactitol system component [Clostridium butyricum]MDN5317705.1 galactitol system component [Thermoanaerobacterium sp.]PHO08534.1 PTS galactitol transporter subunit IIC [Thermoanaerobacterium thermosaccharolyticum]